MNTHTQLDTADGIDALLERVRALQPLIRQHAAQGEQDRRVAEPVIAALTEAGAFKLGTPRRYGGYQGNMKAFLDLSSIVGEADGAGSFANVSPLQRIWRDSNVAARHAVVGPQISYESYGKVLLGIEEQVTPLI